jgi:hypothetical protein
MAIQGPRFGDTPSAIPFVKEPLSFREINPQYSLVQEYLRFSPVLLVQTPELSSFSARHPSPGFSRASPCVYPLFTFRSLVFVQNPPCSPVFLADRSLDLVSSVEFAS